MEYWILNVSSFGFSRVKILAQINLQCITRNSKFAKTKIRLITPLLHYSITPKKMLLGNTIDFGNEIDCCIKLDQR